MKSAEGLFAVLLGVFVGGIIALFVVIAVHKSEARHACNAMHGTLVNTVSLTHYGCVTANIKSVP